MKTTLFKNARILDFDHPKGLSRPHDILVQDGKIKKVGQNLAVLSDYFVVDANDKLLMPGLINGHFHSSVNHMKGSLPSLPLEIFMLYECPELEVLRPSPREAYLRTMLGCIEMLKFGTTSVQDDCFFVPEPDTEILDAVIQAYIDSGMRVRIALDQPELSELQKHPFLADIVTGSIKEKLSQKSKTKADDLIKYYQYLINNWHGAENGRVKAAVSCSAPQRVSKEYLLQLDQISKSHNLPFFAHILETRLQRVFGEVCMNGRSLVQYVDDMGVLSDRMNIIHAVWVDDHDLELIANSNASIAHNPNSNLRLGSGIMPFRKALDLNINVCLGVDEAIADDAVNMWSVMKTAGSIHNLNGIDYATWPNAKEILLAGTQSGGIAMREPKLGTLKVGAPADLILIDLNTLSFSPLNNLPRQLVYCELGNSVRMTMVDGEIVVRDQRLCKVNEDAILSEVRETFAERQDKLHSAFERSNELLPFYKKMYEQAAMFKLDMQRRLV